MSSCSPDGRRSAPAERLRLVVSHSIRRNTPPTARETEADNSRSRLDSIAMRCPRTGALAAATEETSG